MTSASLPAPAPVAVAPRFPAAAKYRLDQFRFFLVVLLIVNVSRIHEQWIFIKKLRPALVLTLFTAAFAYLNPRYLAIGSLFRTFPAKMMVALAVTACLSVPFGISIGHSGLFILQEYSKTLVLTMLVIAAIRNPRDLFVLMVALAIAAGLLAFVGNFMMDIKAAGSGPARLVGGSTYDANDMALVAGVGIAITLLVFQLGSIKTKLACVAIIVLCGMTMARSGSRGGFLGLAVVIVGLLVLLKKVSVGKRVGFVFAIMIGLVIAAPEGYWTQMNTITAPTEDYNWTSPVGRKAVWTRGLRDYMLHTPFGVGVDNFQLAEGTISERLRTWDPTQAGIKWSAAHNSFVQAAAEMGIPGLVLYTWFVFGCAWVLFRLKRKVPDRWHKGTREEQILYYTMVYLPVAILGFAASGFFVSFAYADIVYILAALTAGTIVCVERALEGGEAPVPVPTGRGVRRAPTAAVARAAAPSAPSYRPAPPSPGILLPSPPPPGSGTVLMAPRDGE